MELINGNTAGHTKRTTTNAMFIIGAGAGSFMSSFFFKTSQEPYYQLGFDSMFAAWAIEVVTLLSLFCGLGIDRGDLRGEFEG